MAGIFKSLNKSDIRYTPFRTYKLWYDSFAGVWNDSSVWSDTDVWNDIGYSGSNFTIYVANYNPTSNYPQSDPLKDTFNQGVSFSESVEPTTSNGKYQRVVHKSIYHLYYRDYYTNNKASFGGGDINYQQRYLEDQAYVISMPQSKFGERIASDSIKINLSWSYAPVSGALYNPLTASAAASGVWTVVDDSYGNLKISGSGFYSPYGQYVGGAYTNYTSSVSKRTVGEWPFDDLYQYTDIGHFSVTKSFNKGDWQMESIYNNVKVTFPSGAATPTASDFELLGAVMYFTASQSSSIHIKPNVIPNANQYYNFENGNFSISLLAVPTLKPTHPSGSVLVSKQSTRSDLKIDLNGNIYSEPVPAQFPYKISYTSGSCKVKFERSDGVSTYSITSSVSMSLNTVHHIVAVKSGSAISLHVSSPITNSIDTGTLSISDQLSRNNSDLYIGNTYTGEYGFNGGIDNIKFYNSALTTNDIKILHHTLGVGNVHVGNVFYSSGMMILTAVPIRYSTIHNVECRGTHTIYETEIACTISPGEFGMSSNPSLQVYDSLSNQYVYAPFVTGSQFKPFVTTVGLYDDKGNLVVVGKLNTPIQLPNNMDTTILVRYDK